jgi:signal transduction histidine kinase
MRDIASNLRTGKASQYQQMTTGMQSTRVTRTHADQTTALAQALGAPVRMAILKALSECLDPEGMTVAALARAVRRSERSAADHVRRLRKAGAVVAARNDHTAHYRLADTHFGQTLARMLAAMEAPEVGEGAAAPRPSAFPERLTRDTLVRRLLDTLPLNVMLWEVGQPERSEVEFTVALVNAGYLAARGDGARAANLEGRDYNEIVPDQIRDITLESLRGVRATGEPVLGQLVEHADLHQSPRHYLRSLVPIFDEAGQLRVIAGITLDVTERVEAETRLAEREQQLRVALGERDAFIAMATHELKTPLSALLANLQLMEHRTERILAQRVDDQLGDLRKQQRRAVAAARRLNALINDLLDISRIQAGKLELSVAPLDLAEVTREAVEEQRDLTGRTIQADWPAEPVEIPGDAARLGQVVTNLLTNALKYSPPDRPVHVSVRSLDDGAMLVVRDEGQGIPQDEIGHIFDRFHRVNGVRVLGSAGTAGLGVGLSIAREIVERHGGRVWAESAVGHGSTFNVWLPKEQPGAAGVAG